jgi:hypothetical protein
MIGIMERLRQTLRAADEKHKKPTRIVLSLEANDLLETEMSAIGAVQNMPPTRERRFMDVPLEVRDIEAVFIVEFA